MIRRYNPSPRVLGAMLFKPKDGKWCRYSRVMEEIEAIRRLFHSKLMEKEEQLATCRAIIGEQRRQLDEYTAALNADELGLTVRAQFRAQSPGKEIKKNF